jgi:hypothetical protein
VVGIPVTLALGSWTGRAIRRRCRWGAAIGAGLLRAWTLAGRTLWTRLLPRPRLRRLARLATGLRLALPLSSPRLVLLWLASGSATDTAPAATPASPAAAPGYIRGRWTFGPGRQRHQAVETAWTPSSDLGCGPAFMLPHPVVPFGQPLFKRTLDLRFGRSRFFRPDPRPVRADRIRSGVGIGRFRLYYPFRLEIGHHLGV